MSLHQPVIVVLAYNRPKSLERLLRSLAEAQYPTGVQLIISLEGGASANVCQIAQGFACASLDVTVLQRPERLGLRRHVLACGDFAETHGSVIVLEDDLVVDRFFYAYASQALDFYQDAQAVAGIALYGHEYNEFANLPFSPMANGYDGYAMQVPCSWGQCWSRQQWAAFKAWYEGKQHGDLMALDRLPGSVKSWPESSWKKYFHGFMLVHDRYFIYPYQSYSSNCSDAGGSHTQEGTFLFQTGLALQSRPAPALKFCPIDQRDVLYDSFMEPVGTVVEQWLGLSAAQLEVDLQGIKPVELLRTKPFAVTLKPGGKALRRFAPNFRPPECNLASPLPPSIQGQWQMVESSQIALGANTALTMDWYGYHAHMNLKHGPMLLAMLKVLPGLAWAKWRRKLGGFMNRIFK